MKHRDRLSLLSLLSSGVKATDDRGTRRAEERHGAIAPRGVVLCSFSVAATFIASDKCVSTSRVVVPLCPAFTQAVAGQNGTGNRAGIETTKSTKRNIEPEIGDRELLFVVLLFSCGYRTCFTATWIARIWEIDGGMRVTTIVSRWWGVDRFKGIVCGFKRVEGRGLKFAVPPKFRNINIFQF